MVTASFGQASALEMAKLVRERRVSPVELVDESLRAIETVTADLARVQAREAEAAVMMGGSLGPLHGVPISVKDLIAVGGVRQTFGSQTMVQNIADVDAPSVARLRGAGACIVGKTTTTEFGMKATSDGPLTGITRNPWDLSRTTGGSSCGAAASVAAGVTPAALGTDGGGSVRIPSSFCGLLGIKAQFGRVPVFPYSATPALAHVGPMTRTVRDAALVLGTIAGFDERDPGSVSEKVPDFLAACDESVTGLRLAWSPTLGCATPDREVVEACEAGIRMLEQLGCQIELVERVMDDPFDIWLADFYAGVGTRLLDALRRQREIVEGCYRDACDRDLARSEH